MQIYIRGARHASLMQSARDVVAWLRTQGYGIENDIGREVDAVKPHVKFSMQFIPTKSDRTGKDEYFVTVATTRYASQMSCPTWQAVFEFVRREIRRYDLFSDMAPELKQFLVD
jgi:hypothetical protein